MCVCPLVNALTAEAFDVGTQILVCGTSVWLDLDNISGEFEGQCHRSKFKVARLKKKSYF